MSSRFSKAMERTGQWVFSQEIPTDVVIQVGESSFPLHKFMLISKSGCIRRKILESDSSDLTRIDLSKVPGGAETFEKAAKFCYGVNFEISVYNVAPLRCAAEYLEMTDKYCDGNLAGRTDEFLSQAALKTLPSAVIVLKSCEGLLPIAEELRIVQRCVDIISLKACNESNFPTRSPTEWWASELASLTPSSFQKIIAAMKTRGASPKTLATAVATYAEKSLPDLLPLSGAGPPSDSDADIRSRQRSLIESLVVVLPSDRDAPLPIGFLCCLLRAAIFLDSAIGCRKELEKRISAALDQASVGDLLTISLDYGGERIADMESVRRIISGFVERERGGGSGGIFNGGAVIGAGAVCCSAAMQKVARTVDAFVGEIATDEDLSVSKFAGIAGALPKSARRFDDDLYRAVDIYLKAHPGLDEIEREKVCSVMDSLKLSYEARLHASQNKRLPLQIVLHALYYDQLKLRSGTADEPEALDAISARKQVNADSSLMKENEALRSELTRMKLYMTDMQRGQPSTVKAPKKTKFFSSVSKKLGKLNPFRNVSKDTSNIEDEAVDVTKPRRRRFSIS